MKMNRDQFSDEQAAELEALGYNDWSFIQNVWYNNIFNAFDYLREVHDVRITWGDFTNEYAAYISHKQTHICTIKYTDIYKLRFFVMDYAIKLAKKNL